MEQATSIPVVLYSRLFWLSMLPTFKTEKGYEVRRGAWRKNALLTLVERRDSARSFRGEGSKEHDVLPLVRANIAREGHVTTDEAVQHAKLGNTFTKHR